MVNKIESKHTYFCEYVTNIPYKLYIVNSRIFLFYHLTKFNCVRLAWTGIGFRGFSVLCFCDIVIRGFIGGCRMSDKEIVFSIRKRAFEDWRYRCLTWQEIKAKYGFSKSWFYKFRALSYIFKIIVIGIRCF